MLGGNPNEIWKSIKYESSLKAEIKHSVAPLKIRNYAMLVNKCRITEQSLPDLAKECQNQFKRKWESEREEGHNSIFRSDLERNRATPNKGVDTTCNKCWKNHNNRLCIAGQGVCYACG